MLSRLSSFKNMNLMRLVNRNSTFITQCSDRKFVFNLLIRTKTCYGKTGAKPAGKPDKQIEYDAQKDLALDLSFNNAEEAFKSKKTSELLRALLVYNLCSVSFLVNNNEKIIKWSKKVLGITLFAMIMKRSFYGHFVAGEDQKQIVPVIKRMNAFGVRSILDYSVEEDISEAEAVKREYEGTISEVVRKKPKGKGDKTKSVETVEEKSQTVSGEDDPTVLKQFKAPDKFQDRRKTVSSVRTYFYLNEGVCDRNLEIFQECIRAVSDGNYGTGVAAIKMTALGRPQLLLQISEVIMRARQFVSEVVHSGSMFTNVIQHHLTEEELEERLKKFGINTNKFMKNVVKDKEGVIHLFPWNGIIDENLKLSDTFRIPSLKDGRMVRLITQLSPQEEQMFRNMIHRMNVLVQTAKEYKVPVMVDAEQTYFQLAISRITMEMMHKHNRDEAIVLNTYQCYLKGSYNEALNDLEQARREGFYFGAKIVRGAYLDQERQRSAEMGYADPTNPNFEATTDMYNKTLMEFLRRIKEYKDRNEPSKIMVMVASHNEETVRFAIEQMRKLGLKPQDKTVFFGQLLGMCDYITFPLGQAGYSAYKYVPYGPVVEVLPYLSRRVVENKGVLQKVKKEKKLLLTELIRRVKARQLFYTPPEL